jgi:hypothetical protein
MPALRARKAPAEAGGMSVLTLGNAPAAGAPGKPVLPVVPCYVALPAGTRVDGVEAVCGPAKTLPGTHAIPHGQEPIPLEAGEPPPPTPPDAAVYASDEPWPRARCELVTVQRKRGMSVAVVRLHPVVYRPRSGRVSYLETIELRIRTKPAPAPGDGPAVRVRIDTVRPLAEQVDNPATLQTYGPRREGEEGPR